MHLEGEASDQRSGSDNVPNILDAQEKSNPLKGQELLNYIETQKNQTEDNGDLICIGAGYGSNTEQGETICRLGLFTQELINAKKESHLKFLGKEARLKILDSYNINSLKNIVAQGCISGAAYQHLQITDNELFFDNHRDEITAFLEDQFGPNYIESSVERTGGNKSHWKHRAVWRFIELIAIEEIEKYKKGNAIEK